MDPARLPTTTWSPSTTPKYRCDAGDLLRLDGQDYIYVRPSDVGHVLHRFGSEMELTLTHSDLAPLVRHASFVHRRGYYTEDGAFARAKAGGIESLNDLPPDEQVIILERVHWCERFLEAEARGAVKRSDVSMLKFIDGHQQEILRVRAAGASATGHARKPRSGGSIVLKSPPCPATLRNWLGVYLKGGCRPIALRTRLYRSGNQTPRFNPEVYAAIHRVAANYATEKQPSVTLLHKDLQIEIANLNAARAATGQMSVCVPSIKALRKCVKKLPAFSTYAGRHTLDAARKRYLIVSRRYSDCRPGERIEIDEWEVHLQTVLVTGGQWCQLTDEQRRAATGRYVINFAIDAATRCILGVALGRSATSQLARTTLRGIIMDKSAIARAAGCHDGWPMALTPQRIITDSGSALISNDVTGLICDLGCQHEVAPGKRPEKRPFVERFNRTIGDCLLPAFTGRTFSGVEEKGDYDPQLRASVTPEVIRRAVVRWIVDVYHNEPHDGLAGETPRHAWERLTELFGVLPPPGSDTRCHIFGTELKRQVTLQGIRVAGLYYSDGLLAEEILQNDLYEVTVRVDPDNLGAISLRVADGWRTVPCRTKEIDGLSLDAWIAATQQARATAKARGALAQSTVLAAIKDIKTMAADCEAAVHIDRLQPHADEIARIERELLAGFEVAPDGPATEADKRDVFATAIPVTGALLIPQAPSSPPTPASGTAKRTRRRRTPPQPTHTSPVTTDTNDDIWIED